MGGFENMHPHIAKGAQEQYGLKIEPVSRGDEQKRMQQAQEVFLKLERANGKAEETERQGLIDPVGSIDRGIPLPKSSDDPTLGWEKLIAEGAQFKKKQKEALSDRGITEEIQKTLEKYGYTIDKTDIGTARYPAEIDKMAILITGNRVHQEVYTSSPITGVTVERDTIRLQFKNGNDSRLPTIDPLIGFQQESDILITEQASGGIQFYDSIQNRIKCYQVILGVLDASIPVNSGSTYLSQEKALEDGMRRVGIRRMIDNPTVHKLLSGKNSLSHYFESKKQ